jgi:hypothetical protein
MLILEAKPRELRLGITFLAIHNQVETTGEMVDRQGRKLFTLRHPPYPLRTKLLWENFGLNRFKLCRS